MYVCSGGDLNLDWLYTTSPSENVEDVQWTYNGHSQEIIALSVHGNFFVTPTFSHRVEKSTNGGIILRHVVTGDAGTYSIEVTWADASHVQHTERRSVNVVVASE